jgi:flagellar hook-length control protein FliK
MFVAAACAARVPSRPNAVKKAAQFSPTPDDNLPSVNIPETTKTDNTPTSTETELVNKPPQDFSQTLRKTVTTETPPKADGNTTSKKQDLPSGASSKINPAQLPATPVSTISVAPLIKEVATTAQPKAGHLLAQLTANLSTDKSPPVTGQAAKAAEIKLLLTTGEKGQLGLKTVLPDTSNSQLGLKTVLTDTPKGAPTADTQLGEGKNADELLMPNKTVVPTTIPDSGENTKELIHEALLNNDSKATTTGVKTATADKPAISDTQETPPLNTNCPLVQDKSSGPQSQLAGISPEKSVPTPTADIPTDNKAIGDQQCLDPILQNTVKSEPGQTLSASSDCYAKEQAGNLSGDSTVQKLNVTNVQISTGQTKDRGDSTSDNNSNSNFEQILSQNNPQTPITEQSPASAEALKTANLPEQTSSSDVSAGIGKQILESIHNSLSQQGENQQITVRLNPPELGKVFIKFQEQDAQITGLLEVNKAQTRYEIEQALPQIIRDLADCGIVIKRIEVLLSDGQESEQQALKDQSPQNGWTQQQDSANPGAGANNTPANEWLTNDNIYTGLHELQEMFVSDHSINMLI